MPCPDIGENLFEFSLPSDFGFYQTSQNTFVFVLLKETGGKKQ